jgi:hypothetical protein
MHWQPLARKGDSGAEGEREAVDQRRLIGARGPTKLATALLAQAA